MLLDLIRGIAALLVFIGHWRNLFFLDFTDLPHKQRMLLAPFYLLTSAGHQSVVVFFVLSGFFISGAIVRGLQRGTFNWRGYITHRLVRLWIVVLPGLALCLFWDRLGIALHRAPLLYGGARYNHMIGEVAPALTWQTLLGNIFFLQTVLTPTFGSDGALWSLANEFWYYMLFPLGLLSVWHKPAMRQRVITAVLAILVAWWLRTSVLPLFGIWLMGALLERCKTRDLGPGARAVAVLTLLAAMFVFARFVHWSPLVADYTLAVITAVCLWVVVGDRRPANEGAAMSRFSRGISRFSFSLYVLHIPLFVFLASVFLHNSRWNITLPHIFAALSLLVVTAGYAWVVAWATEFRTDRVRIRVERAVGIRKPDPASAHQKVLAS